MPLVARSTGLIGYPTAEYTIQEWKVTAVHEAAYYATVQSQIQQEAYDEARQTLDQWELEFPLSKLYGDYPLAQARYYMALQYYQRARGILAHYRESVDLTNYLPEAMKLELECLQLMGQHEAAMNLARTIIKRLPNHPLATEAKAELSSGNQNRREPATGGRNKPRSSNLSASENNKLNKLSELFKADPATTDDVNAADKTSE
jgi:TolA-binding protein